MLPTSFGVKLSTRNFILFHCVSVSNRFVLKSWAAICFRPASFRKKDSGPKIFIDIMNCFNYYKGIPSREVIFRDVVYKKKVRQ